jgi:hypothetical protein
MEDQRMDVVWSEAAPGQVEGGWGFEEGMRYDERGEAAL